MIIEHYGEKPMYVISALRINNMYGEPLSSNKQYYEYLTSDYSASFTSLIDLAGKFASVEKAALWWSLTRKSYRRK